jgi:hypothetical protein
MTERGGKQPDRPVQDRTPRNILQRPVKFSMRQIKDAEKGCRCRRPILFHHPDGRVTCVRCRGLVEEGEE